MDDQELRLQCMLMAMKIVVNVADAITEAEKIYRWVKPTTEHPKPEIFHRPRPPFSSAVGT